MRRRIATASDAHRSPTTYWASFGAIAVCIFFVNFFTRPYDYADYDTYVIYLDSLVHFPPENWFYFEPLSNFYLLAIHWLLNSVEPSIWLAHYLLGALFLVLLVKSSSPRDSAWQNLLFSFAVLGPLLAFVTLRATPAYFLTAVSVTHAARRDPRAWLYFVLAALFHASALLAAVPLALLYFEDRFAGLAKLTRSPRLLVLSIVALAVFGVLAAAFAGYAISVIQSVPVLSKYVAYTADSSSNTVSSINHYIFLLFVTILVITLFLVGNEKTVRINGYILVSFAIYIGLFFATSPVAAFRQTPFWLLPLIALFPWRRVGVVEATAPLFIILCSGLFYFQFMQVYF